MRLVYMGNNDRGVRCLEALVDTGHEVAGVVAHPDPPVKPFYASVKEKALSLGIPVVQPELAVEAGDTVRKWKPELVVLSGYSRILPKSMLHVAPRGCINLHGGKLPEYRGAAPLNWSIINGEKEGGLSIIQVDEGIDTGDILAQERFAIGPNDTIADVLALSLERLPLMLVNVLEEMEAGTLTAIRQDPSAGTCYSRRTPRDGIIHWREKTVEQVHNLIRALTRPYPGAFSVLDGRKVMIWKSRVPRRRTIGVPGRVLLRHGEELLVMCRDRAIAVCDVTDESGSPLRPPVGADLET